MSRGYQGVARGPPRGCQGLAKEGQEGAKRSLRQMLYQPSANGNNNLAEELLVLNKAVASVDAETCGCRHFEGAIAHTYKQDPVCTKQASN